jgi:predicted DNA-binding protein (MmcQ/YjbR family)
MFDLTQLREYCLSKKCTSEDFPFDETILVFRIGGKIFCFTDIEHIPFSFNLKCEPERAIELRERYSSITPGYHCNKKHWNTLIPEHSLSIQLIKDLVDHSYDLVFNSLKKSKKQAITESE